MALAAMASEELGGRHHGEVSMESFIKNQMMAILQPFVDHVQGLEAKLVQCQEHLQKHDAGLSSVWSALGDTNTDLSGLRGAVKKTDAGVAAVCEGLERVAENSDELHLGMENMNGWVQRIHNQVELTAKEVPDLHRLMGEIETQMQELHANLQRTNDSVSHDVRGALGKLGEELGAVQRRSEETTAELERLRGEAARKSQLLQETRAVVDKSAATVATLQRSSDTHSTNVADSSRQLEGLKGTFCKLQPVVEGLRKDSTFLKQRQEHHDTVVHSLQQNQGTLHATQETMQVAHEKLAREVQVLDQGLCAARAGLDDTRESLGRANAFANTLHAGSDKLSQELQTTGQRMTGLEEKHASLSEALGRTASGMTELSREHRRGNVEVQALRHDLDKTGEALAHTKDHVDATNERLNSLGGDLGRTNETMRRLDSGMELCQAGFSGLQKGFVETGAHIARRPPGSVTLPKLPTSPGSDQFTRVGLAQLCSSPPKASMVATEKPTWMQDEDQSTQHGSQYSSRKTSFATDGTPFTAR